MTAWSVISQRGTLICVFRTMGPARRGVAASASGATGAAFPAQKVQLGVTYD